MTSHRGKPKYPLLPVVGMVAAVVLLAGAGTYAVVRAGDDPPAGAGSPPTPSTTRSGLASSGSSTAPAATSTTTDRAASATAALTRCVETVRAQEAVARAAASSAANWTTHTDAQRRLDNGTNTLAETTAAWARSRVRGPGDVQAFATASAILKRASSGCGTVVGDTAGTAMAARGSACQQRSKLLATVVATGTTVNSQWSAHVTMMANKAHTDGAKYHDRWLEMVRDAGPALEAYRSAAAAAARAPACTAGT